jgi:hypothetical protein
VTSATDRQPTKSPTVRYWIHPDKQRYYQAELVLDLFGCWTLTTFFGGLQNRRGNYRLTAVASFEEGLRELDTLDRRRQCRGYLAVPSRNRWRELVRPPRWEPMRSPSCETQPGPFELQPPV